MFVSISEADHYSSSAYNQLDLEGEGGGRREERGERRREEREGGEGEGLTSPFECQISPEFFRNKI